MPRDPYRAFRFEVEIDGFTRAGFATISGLSHTVEQIEYREGGENETPRKLPGRSTFEDVTCERGLSDDSDFLQWMTEIYDSNRDDAQGEVEGWRRTVIVYQKDKAGNRVKKWTVYNAWPSEHSLGDFDASADEVSMETLVLANEGIQQESLV